MTWWSTTVRRSTSTRASTNWTPSTGSWQPPRRRPAAPGGVDAAAASHPDTAAPACRAPAGAAGSTPDRLRPQTTDRGDALGALPACGRNIRGAETADGVDRQAYVLAQFGKA